MKLNVPLVRQDKDSVDCGLAGLEMLLKFHGSDLNIEQIKKVIAPDETGTYAPQLGEYLIDNGFSVGIITMQPSLFTTKDSRLSQSQIFNQMLKRRKKTKKPHIKTVLNHFNY